MNNVPSGNKVNTIPAGKWLNRKEAAAYLRMKPKTLANLASLDRGPKCHRPSPRHVLYFVDDLDNYARGGVN